MEKSAIKKEKQTFWKQIVKNQVRIMDNFFARLHFLERL